MLSLVVLLACVVRCDVGDSNDSSTIFYLHLLATLVTDFEFFSKTALFLGEG